MSYTSSKINKARKLFSAWQQKERARSWKMTFRDPDGLLCEGIFKTILRIEDTITSLKPKGYTDFCIGGYPVYDPVLLDQAKAAYRAIGYRIETKDLGIYDLTGPDGKPLIRTAHQLITGAERMLRHSTIEELETED